MSESLKIKKERASIVYKRLEEKYPNVGTFLTHNTPFQLLIAVILSAQCTDDRVNLTTPALFKAYPDAKSMSNADIDHLKILLKSINFFNNKAINCKKTATLIHSNYQDKVPANLEDLISLPGVGRKTANVVLGQAFDMPGITVDTHVKRLSRRLGFTNKEDPVEVEFELMTVWKKEEWSYFSSILILHGRETCMARNPNCDHCLLLDCCPQKYLPKKKSARKKPSKRS